MHFRHLLILTFLVPLLFSCEKKTDEIKDTTDQIHIDSIVSTSYIVKAWDTVFVRCYASGEELKYAWECDHGTINGSGHYVKYAAGECCVGLNTILCTVSNSTGSVHGSVKIEVTSYFYGEK